MAIGTFVCKKCKKKFEAQPKGMVNEKYVTCYHCNAEQDVTCGLFGVVVNVNGQDVRLVNIEAEFFRESKTTYIFYLYDKIVANVTRSIITKKIIKLNGTFN